MAKKYKSKDRFKKSEELRGPGRSEFGHSRGQGWGPGGRWGQEHWRGGEEDRHRMGVPGRDRYPQEESGEYVPEGGPGRAFESGSQYGYDRLGGYRERGWNEDWDEQARARTVGPERESWMAPGPYSGIGPQGYQRSDERILEEVSERLTRHGQVDAAQIQVSVQNGEVTLTGIIEDRRQKRLAEDAIENISGVRDVHNQLRVRQQTAGFGQSGEGREKPSAGDQGWLGPQRTDRGE